MNTTYWIFEKSNVQNIRRSDFFWKHENNNKCDVLKAEKTVIFVLVEHFLVSNN